jgi:hypothetical protein
MTADELIEEVEAALAADWHSTATRSAMSFLTTMPPPV